MALVRQTAELHCGQRLSTNATALTATLNIAFNHSDQYTNLFLDLNIIGQAPLLQYQITHAVAESSHVSTAIRSDPHLEHIAVGTLYRGNRPQLPCFRKSSVACKSRHSTAHSAQQYG
eukprot:18342-Heterococcus_DN1.PRE.2